MKKLFAPIFLVTLLMLNVFHYTGANRAILPPFILIVFAAAVCFFLFRKYLMAYGCLTLAIALLISFQFLTEKEVFWQTVETPVLTDEYITIAGKLMDFPEIQQDHSILLVKTTRVEYHQKKQNYAFTIRIKVKGNLKDYCKGDRINISAKVYKSRSSKNFYDNGLDDYRLLKGTHFSGYCKSAEMIALESPSSNFWQIVGDWRNSIREVIAKKYSANSSGVGEPANRSSNESVNGKTDENLDEKGVFLQSILIGDRGQLGNRQREKLLGAGVFHLLAISGAHIGIIALFSLLLLKRFKVSYTKRYIITGLLLVLFLILSGFKISAERAVIMALLIFVSRILYVKVDIYNIISFAGLFMLMLNPAQFLDVGFILTVTLTAAIVTGRNLFLPLFAKWGKNVLPGRGFDVPAVLKRIVPEKWVDDPSPIRDKLTQVYNYFSELVCANLSASLIALPLSLYYFKRYTFAGFLSGLLLLPLTAIITAGGVLLLLLAPISGDLSGVLLFFLDWPLQLFFSIVDFFSGSLEFLTIFRASPPFYLVLLVLVGFYAAAELKKIRVKMVPGAIVIIVIVFVSVNFFYYSPKHLEVFYLDVGQGDSQVVVFPNGDGLLIDGGGTYFSDFQVGRRIVLPFLLQKRINIKYVAVSHFHPDHAKGVTEIINILQPEELWLSSEMKGNIYYDRLMSILDSSVRIKRVGMSFRRRIGGCRVEMLSPMEIISGSDAANNDSQVLKISDGRHSFLLCGDIEYGVESWLSGEYCDQLRAEVLKVPHHGSQTSSSRSLLECVKPEWAIFSYGHKNRFHFPHREVMERYRRMGVKCLSTARVGGIRVISYPGTLGIETSR